MKKTMELVYASDADLTTYRANAIHVMKMCQALSLYFSDVSLYCHKYNKNENIYNLYGVKKTFEIIPCENNPILSKGILHILLSSYLNAKKINKKNVVVYARSIWTLFFVNKDKPFFYEVHNYNTNTIYRYIESKVLKRSTLINLIAISQPLKEIYSTKCRFLSCDKIKVLHDGADIIPDISIDRTLLKNEKSEYPNVTIGYIGSLYPGKCMEVLMPIAKEIPRILIHVVGGDEYWIKYWKKECENQKIYNIIFYGSVVPKETTVYYKEMDIVLLPYSNNIYVDKNKKLNIGKWISPLKLFEAMSCKKAIIASNLTSIEEVIENNVDAILVDPSLHSEWVTSIKKLIDNNELRNQLGKNALKKFSTNYSWSQRAKNIYIAYEQA